MLQLKSAEPDVVIFVSYTSDAISVRQDDAYAELGSHQFSLAMTAAFSDTAFITAVGDTMQGAVSTTQLIRRRQRRALRRFVVNELCIEKHAGHLLDDTSARGMQGFLALMEAINRAGSTDPAKIQAALRSQDLKPEQLMIGYNGVKYDAKGQNMLAATLLVHMMDWTEIRLLSWPDKSAVHPPVAPFKGWTWMNTELFEIIPDYAVRCVG